jgi:DNA-binding NtrC family response regulator
MSKKILVIDDEQLILFAVERGLSTEGYFISKAQNLQQLNTALKDAPFDLLITDLYMEEASSADIIEMVKKTSPSVKVVRMSGSININDYSDFIEKPFRIDELREKVRDILNEPS